jgi:hypothetical protein
MLTSFRNFINHPRHYAILILPFFLFALTLPVTLGLVIAEVTSPSHQTLGVTTYEKRTPTTTSTENTTAVTSTTAQRKPQTLECSMCGGGSLCLDQNRKQAMCVPSSYASTAAKMSNVICVSCATPTVYPTISQTSQNCKYVEVLCKKAPCPKQYICN